MVRKLTALARLAVVLVGLVVSQPLRAYDRQSSQDCNQTVDNDRAILACTRLLATRDLSNQVRALAYGKRAWAFASKGDDDHAIADYSEAIRLDTKFAIAYHDRARAYHRKSDYDRAISDYSEAIRLDPNIATVFNDRGKAYREKGDYDRAIADFDEAIRIDRKLTFAYVNRGVAYFAKGDLDRAIADEGEAIRIDPKNGRAHGNRAYYYYKKGNYDQAIADYDQALRINPTNTTTYLYRGNAYSAKGEYERAIASYGEAIRLDPLDPEPKTARGLAYETIAEIAKARDDFTSALAIPQRSETEKLAQDKARERLAALANGPAAASVVAVVPPSTVTAVVVASAPVAADDRRIALVIGNSAYENIPALPNPERDATLVGDVLKRTGFESVTVLSNLRKDALTAALRNFATQAENADWAVVYYAGHGMEVGGINYMIPVDARIAADRDIGFEGVPLEQVLNAAERAKKLRLVILDACRDNPFASQMKRTMTVASRSVTRGLAAVEPEAGTLVVYAAKDGETAIDGDGNDSPFALAFVKNLQTPGLEIRRLFDYVRDDVMEATGRKQKPFSYGSISGRQDFYFVASK
jgi:tetratricopeptide (TPR) repeat protein